MVMPANRLKKGWKPTPENFGIIAERVARAHKMQVRIGRNVFTGLRLPTGNEQIKLDEQLRRVTSRSAASRLGIRSGAKRTRIYQLDQLIERKTTELDNEINPAKVAELYNQIDLVVKELEKIFGGRKALNRYMVLRIRYHVELLGEFHELFKAKRVNPADN